MSNLEMIETLAEICRDLLDIVRRQHSALEQMGAVLGGEEEIKRTVRQAQSLV